MMRSSRLSLKEILSIQPLCGREPDEDPNPGAGDPTGDVGGDNQPDGDDPGSEDQGGDDPQAKIRALTEERQRHYERRQEAERKLQEATQKLSEFERKDKSELENAQADVKTLTDENNGLKATVKKLAMDNAFLTVNDITWHNPATALRLADLDGVEIDADGKVDTKALKAAMKKLADENPYLVKTADSTDSSPTPTTRTGNPSSGSTKQSQREKDARARLLQDYPSLRQHVG